MLSRLNNLRIILPLLATVALGYGVPLAAADWTLGPEQLVQAGGTDILVSGYSVPSFVHWNGDSLPDLVVGEGGNGYNGKVRVYLNSGTLGNPQFSTFVYAQSNGVDLSLPPAGCLGAFPRTVYWDADGRKDLVVGRGDGTVSLFQNTGTDDGPTFDGGTFVQVGQPGNKVNIDVGNRATSAIVDWNSDGKKDLAIGAYDGQIHVFVNEGTDSDPDFRTQTLAQANGVDLVVSFGRSSPVLIDLDGDGKKDLLTGNTNGQLLLYLNVGNDAAPNFASFSAVESNGVPIDLPGTPRSRPSVCDWNSDGVPDVLIGAEDGKLHLYAGVPEPAAVGLALLAVASLTRFPSRGIHPARKPRAT